MSERDIVERLRAPESWRSFPDPDDDAPKLAAAEIERLRARVKQLEVVAAAALERAGGFLR
jgi:hypothetical protein